ncbi:hypothetical protein [Delftia acidovorans]
MHHSSTTTPTDRSTTHTRLAHPPSWLLACAMGLALTACGGGSGNDGGAGDAGTGTDGGTRSGVFIAASGALCAKRSNTGNCVQPTSSAIEEAELVKTIIDPDAQKPLIDFDAMGFIINNVLTYSQEPGMPPKGSITTPSYGMERRHIQAGRNTFTIAERSYPNATYFPTAGHTQYKKEGINAAVTFRIGSPQDHQEGEWGTSLDESRNISVSGSMPNMRSENTGWMSGLHLLTDQADAPKEKTVIYVGSVAPSGGTGEVLNEHTTNSLGTGVSYEAELDTSTGMLTGVMIDFTDPKSQRRTVLELPPLKFENSRLTDASRRQRIDIRLEGPGSDSRAGAPLPDTAHTQLDFSLDGLEGEITGKQAQTIQILGGGPKGFMQLVLMRKDRVDPEDRTVDIPLVRPAQP